MPQQEPLPRLPQAVRDAQAAIRSWLSEITGCTEAEIIDMLGPPKKRGIWVVNDSEELLCDYELLPRTILRMHFVSGAVLLCSVQILGDS